MPKDIPQHLSRRDFLKVAGLATAGAALASCGLPQIVEPTRTGIPRPRSTKVPRVTNFPEIPTPYPTKTEVPPEIIELGIPNLEVKKYKIEIEDVTDQLVKGAKKEFQEIVRSREEVGFSADNYILNYGAFNYTTEGRFMIIFSSIEYVRDIWPISEKREVR